MTIAQLNKQLTDQLQAYIKREGYVDTGNLVKNVKFKCKFANDKLEIKLNAPTYIVYLDDGNFINRFYTLEDTKDTVKEFLAENLNIGFTEE